MSIYTVTFKDDKVINDILNKNCHQEPKIMVYHGGPWHGKREPYDPQKRDVLPR